MSKVFEIGVLGFSGKNEVVMKVFGFKIEL